MCSTQRFGRGLGLDQPVMKSLVMAYQNACLAQLGVMLLYVRISNNNRMLPFCSEVSRVILDLLGSPKEPPAGQEVPQPAAQEICNSALVPANANKQPQQGARFAGLQVCPLQFILTVLTNPPLPDFSLS